MEVRTASELPLTALTPLVEEARAAGFDFLERLVDEWRAGTNRFDRPGEALFVAEEDGELVGVCGLNRDPWLDDPRVGRVRHLYVRADRRRRGVGRALVTAVLDAAVAASFERVRLRTPAAAAFYEALGFERVQGEPEATHARALVTAAADVPACPSTLPDGFRPAGSFGARLGRLEVAVLDDPPILLAVPSGLVTPRLVRADLDLAREFGDAHPAGWDYVVDLDRVRGVHPLNPLWLRRIPALPNLRRYVVVASRPWARRLLRALAPVAPFHRVVGSVAELRQRA